MKKVISLLMVVIMCLSLSVSAFADTPDAGVSEADSTEIVWFTYDSSDGTIEATYTETDDGFSVFEYHDGELYEMTRYTYGNTFYERQYVNSQSDQGVATHQNSEWEIVNIESATTKAPATLTPRWKTTRDLGYMHYRGVTETYSIFCYVEEWYNDAKTVTLSGKIGSAADCATTIAGTLGLPASIATGLVSTLIYAFVLKVVNNIVHAVVDTDVTADVVDQRIHGDCTSHSGKKHGDLGDASIINVTSDNSKYSGETFYEGYTTHMWGTGELGSQMFWKVFGVEYTPTSWTGI